MAPLAGMALADLGCDVVRVDPPARPNPDQKTWTDSLCRHKNSIVIDFKAPASRAAFLELLSVTDILIETYRPGVFDRMIGMSAEELCQRYPRLIYARVTGFSRYDTTYARSIGHENNFIAVSGALPALQYKLNETIGYMPTPNINYLADFGGGSMSCVVGILAAVIHRTTSGKGQIVDASVQQSTSYLATFTLQRRNGQPADEPSLAVNGSPWAAVYQTSDGRYMMVSSIEDALFDRMLRELGLDPAAMPDRADRHSWPNLRTLISDKFASQSQQYWRKIFDHVPAGVTPVLDADDAGVDINQPLVHLSRTPALPTVSDASTPDIPRMMPGQGDEDVLRRWLGPRSDTMNVNQFSRVLCRVNRTDREPKL